MVERINQGSPVGGGGGNPYPGWWSTKPGDADSFFLPDRIEDYANCIKDQLSDVQLGLDNLKRLMQTMRADINIDIENI